ncbi:hypothetical protein [Bacillus cereus]|nr:hypothetical protein [Bacillus cereus]
MEIKIKNKERELFFKMSTPVAMSLISTVATGVGTLVFKLFM